MPAKQILNVTRSKDPKRVKIGLSFEFAADDPQAVKIYQAIALCLKEAFTPAEARQFLRKLDAARKKARAEVNAHTA